jgi:hypothetical protein
LNDADRVSRTAPFAGPPVIDTAGAVVSSSNERIADAVLPTWSVTVSSTL